MPGEVLALEDVEVRQGHRGGDRVAAEGDPVREEVGAVQERLGEPVTISVAPSGTYPLVMPFAQVMMSGW